MQPAQVGHAADSRLRFVFDGTVLSFSLAADATFGDIARTLGELSRQRYGNPVAIDVALPSADLSGLRASTASSRQ